MFLWHVKVMRILTSRYLTSLALDQCELFDSSTIWPTNGHPSDQFDSAQAVCSCEPADHRHLRAASARLPAFGANCIILSYCPLKDARFFKFHVAWRILLHSSWNMFNQANTLYILVNICPLWKSVSLEERMISAPNCKNLHGQFCISYSVCQSLFSSNFWEKGLLEDWPKIQWCRTQHTRWLEVIQDLVLPCWTLRKAIIDAAIIDPFFSHLLSVCAIRWHFRMPKDSRDAKDGDKVLGRRTASFHFSDQPMPLVWSSIVDTPTRVFWTHFYRFDLHMQSLYWLHCLFLLHILW